MWIMLNNAFLSIVDPKAPYSGGKGPVSDKLLVRARIKGDIEAVFPGAKVAETPKRDYRYRAEISRADVANAMAAEVLKLGYGNFKGSVPDKRRHDAYADVWSVMYAEQQRRHGGRGKRTTLGDLLDY
jgi:hypothetical protein